MTASKGLDDCYASSERIAARQGSRSIKTEYFGGIGHADETRSCSSAPVTRLRFILGSVSGRIGDCPSYRRRPDRLQGRDLRPRQHRTAVVDGRGRRVLRSAGLKVEIAAMGGGSQGAQ